MNTTQEHTTQEINKREHNTQTNTIHNENHTLSSLIHSALTKPTTQLLLPFFPYTLQSRVVITGIGADELCGGYTRYQAAYNRGGYEASWQQCTGDWERLWYRNLVNAKRRSYK